MSEVPKLVHIYRVMFLRLYSNRTKRPWVRMSRDGRQQQQPVQEELPVTGHDDLGGLNGPGMDAANRTWRRNAAFGMAIRTLSYDESSSSAGPSDGPHLTNTIV